MWGWDLKIGQIEFLKMILNLILKVKDLLIIMEYFTYVLNFP